MGNGSSQYLKILFPGGDVHYPSAMQKVSEILATVRTDIVCTSCPVSELAEHVKDAHIIVPLAAKITRPIMEQAGFLVLVMQFGASLEGVDMAAASEMGIPVSFVPSHGTGTAESVSEIAIFHTIQCLRNVQGMRQSLGSPLGRTLFGANVMIMGLGTVGCAIAERIRPFSPARLSGTCRTTEDGCDLVDAFGSEEETLALAKGADVVFVCISQESANHGIVNTNFLTVLRRGAVLVNVAGMDVLNVADVHAALISGHLGSVGIDSTFLSSCSPPLPPPGNADALLSHPQCYTTPHIGGATSLSYDCVAQYVCDNVIRLLDGRPLRHVANRGVFDVQ